MALLPLMVAPWVQVRTTANSPSWSLLTRGTSTLVSMPGKVKNLLSESTKASWSLDTLIKFSPICGIVLESYAPNVTRFS